MADVYLTQRDIDYISRVVATEVPASIAQSDPAEYSRMVGAVVDTITNRMASGEYPSTVTGVVNQRNQFSAINGPIPGAWGSVQNAPKASPALQSLVAGHIADISQGVEESEIGGSMNYANPNFSSARNLRDWINPMIEAGAVKLGLGDAVHYHGIIPGDEAVGPYNLSAEGIPTTPNVAVPVDNPMKGLLAVVDPYDPNANLRTGTLMAPVSTDWGAMAQANQAQQQNPGLLANVDVLSATREEIGTPTQEVAAADDTHPGWGLNRDVAPALIPTVESWSEMAAAKPVQAPVQQPSMNVAATGLLGATPALEANAVVAGTGVLSPGFQQIEANTDAQLADPSRLAPMVEQQTPSMQAFASGLLGGTPALSASAVAQPQQQVASVNPGLLSPTRMMDMAAPMSINKGLGILSQPVTNPGYLAMSQPAVNPQTLAAPALETTTVKEMPTVADVQVQGPATTPALEQQAQQEEEAQQQITAPSVTSRVMPKSVPTQGLLQQQAAQTTVPAATQQQGLLSGIADRSSGLLGGLLGPGFSAPTTNIGGGMSNIAGLYSGAFAPGNFAVANNGATITAQPGGWSTYTNKYGVTEAIGPDGKIAGYFGSGVPDPDAESNSSGGFFGGLFG